MNTVRRLGKDDEIESKLSLEKDDEENKLSKSSSSFSSKTDDTAQTAPKMKRDNDKDKKNSSPSISHTGLKVLGLLAFQNSFKNLLMRYVMQEKPHFLLSTAVITVELLKLLFSTLYIVFIEKSSLLSIYRFIFKDDRKNTMLVSVPATCYIIQMALEYIAFANIDAASFSVLVQLKVLFTAFFFKIVLGKKLMKKQFLSLFILTVGVMLCNMQNSAGGNEDLHGDKLKGIMATLGIAISSGFASVYTEKVIKSARSKSATKDNEGEKYGLAHMQCQLAIVSLFILGFYSYLKDYKSIKEGGLFQEFNGAAFLSCLNSAVGGLIVAAVLKYADSVVKGYATAISVVLTGIASKQLFGTNLSLIFMMGIINVIVSVMLYNANGLDDFIC